MLLSKVELLAPDDGAASLPASCAGCSEAYVVGYDGEAHLYKVRPVLPSGERSTEEVEVAPVGEAAPAAQEAATAPAPDAPPAPDASAAQEDANAPAPAAEVAAADAPASTCRGRCAR